MLRKGGTRGGSPPRTRIRDGAAQRRVARVAAHADAEASAGLLLRIVGNALNNLGAQVP